MKLEQTVTQLEFPFLNEIRMRLYAIRQREEMNQVYKNYEHGIDGAPRMRFGEFLQEIWIKGGFAKRFHERHHNEYFYDADGITLYKEHQKPYKL